MANSDPSFFARIGFAFIAFFRTLGSGSFAAIVRDGAPQLPETASPPEEEVKEARAPVLPKVERSSPDAALQLLGLLQRDGRLIDFLHEPVETFSDEQIGAAARVVHEGCKKAIDQHFKVVPVHEREEESRVEVPKGFDPASIRLTGNVVGEAPFHGVLQHRGWKVDRVELPKLSEEHDPSILAPAEVEL